MRVVILGSLVFLIFSLNVVAETLPATTLRKLFHNAVLDPSQIQLFVNQVDKIREPSALEMAYKAAAEALKAQEEWNPVEKFLYLRKFKKIMDKAVQLGGGEIEIRFLRFGIQYNIPVILGFSNNMLEDKVMIMEGVSRIERFEVDPFFIRYILTLLSDSGLCTSDEIEMIRTRIQT